MVCPENLSQSECDEFWMAHALTLAKKAEAQGEVPVGAVLVQAKQLIAEGWNQTIQNHDPTAHAEMIALRQAGKRLENYRLPELTLYVTLEPCPMCSGALVHSRIDRLVIATEDPRTGAAGSVFNLTASPQLNHQIETEFGVLKDLSSQLLKDFFRNKRNHQKQQKILGKDGILSR